MNLSSTSCSYILFNIIIAIAIVYKYVKGEVMDSRSTTLCTGVQHKIRMGVCFSDMVCVLLATCAALWV